MRRLSTSQEERPRQKPTLKAPWSWTSSLQNSEKINFCCLSHHQQQILMFKHLGYLVILIAAWADQYWSLPQNRQETFDLLKRERFWPKSSSASANEFVSCHRVWAVLNVTSQDKKAPRGTGLPHIHPKHDVPSRAHTYIYHVEITLPSIEQCRVIVSLVGERVQLHGVRMLPGTHKSLPHPPVYLFSVHSWLPTYLCSRIKTGRDQSSLGAQILHWPHLQPLAPWMVFSATRLGTL